MAHPRDVSSRPLQARKRAILKTPGYRLLMVAITITAAWVVLGDARSAVDIGIAANVVKTGTDYAYERLWDRISWGLFA